MCVLIWGSFIVLPLFLMCCNFWKKCTYPLYDVNEAVYDSLGRLARGGSLMNLTLNVADNTFNASKANILYNALCNSGLKGFTFINTAHGLDLDQDEYSNFKANMAPIRGLTNIVVDARWYSGCCM